jgi:hypothetical protein
MNDADFVTELINEGLPQQKHDAAVPNAMISDEIVYEQ